MEKYVLQEIALVPQFKHTWKYFFLHISPTNITEAFDNGWLLDPMTARSVRNFPVTWNYLLFIEIVAFRFSSFCFL